MDSVQGMSPPMKQWIADTQNNLNVHFQWHHIAAASQARKKLLASDLPPPLLNQSFHCNNKHHTARKQCDMKRHHFCREAWEPVVVNSGDFVQLMCFLPDPGTFVGVCEISFDVWHKQKHHSVVATGG